MDRYEMGRVSTVYEEQAYDNEVAKCADKACREAAAKLKGEQYKSLPLSEKGKGEWIGERGDGRCDDGTRPDRPARSWQTPHTGGAALYQGGHQGGIFSAMATKPIIIPNIENVSSETVAANLNFVERRYGASLPHQYASFMRNYDGGPVHPCHFAHHHPMVFDQFGEENAALQYLHSSADLREKAGFDFDKVSWPPMMLPIGTVSGGDDILLSLEQSSFGRIFYWLRVLDVGWGEGENNVLPLVADNFGAFLRALFVDDDLGDPPPWNRIGTEGDPRIVPLAL